MANPGVYPVDPTTQVGQVRLTLGDVTAVDLVPAVTGMADFSWFSDAEIAQFILAASSNTLRAVGIAVMQLATGAGLKGYTVKSQDLSMDASKRGQTLEVIANSYFAQALAVDEADARDAFSIVAFPGLPPDPNQVQDLFGWFLSA